MTANPLRGEIDFKVGDKPFVLCYPTNSIALVEELFAGRDIVAIVNEWQASPTLSTLRALLWGALQKHHGSIDLLAVGDLIDDIGADQMESLGEAIGKAIRFRLSGTFEPPKPKDAPDA